MAEEVDDPDRPAPGFCFPGDECAPGNEARVCDGPSTCGVNPPVSFCAPAGDVREGGECTIEFDEAAADGNCRSGLYCAYGTCQPSCNRAADCGGGDCIDFTDRLDGVDFRFCHDGCNVYAQAGCGGDDTCVLFDEDQDGNAISGCLPDLQSGRLTQNQDCVNDGETYWGTCHAGHLCTQLNREPEPRSCLGFCDREDQSLCTGESRCVFNVLNGLTLGLCLGDCTPIGDESGCPGGGFCQFGWVGTDERGDDIAAGLCAEGAQALGTGEECVVDRDTGTHDCVNGHLCVVLQQGAPPTCVRLCDDDVACPDGAECATGLFGGDAQGDGASESIGICGPG